MAPKVRKRKFVVTVWRDSTNWYWKLTGSNGTDIAYCPVAGYSSKRNAENAVRSAGRVFAGNAFSFRYPNEQIAAAA